MQKKWKHTLTLTVCPVCLLSPSPLPKSPDACGTEKDRRYTKNIKKLWLTYLKIKHSRCRSRPRRRTNAQRPEGFPPLSALRSHPKKKKNTNTHAECILISPWWQNSLRTISHDISFLWNLQRDGKCERMTHAEEIVVSAAFRHLKDEFVPIKKAQFWMIFGPKIAAKKSHVSVTCGQVQGQRSKVRRFRW